MQRKFFTVLAILLLTTFGALVIPSEYYTQDMVIHIPVLKSLKDSSLYPRDYTKLYSRVPQENISLYYPLVNLITTISPFSLEHTFRILFYVYLFSYLLIIWKFSEELTNKKFLNCLITLLIILVHFQIGGAAISVVEAEFLPRALGTITSLGGAYFFIRKRYTVGFLLYIFSFLIHPLEVFYILYITAVFLIYTVIKKSRSKIHLIFILFLPLIISVYLFTKNMIISREWLYLIKLRSAYVFLSLWSFKAWFNLIIVLIPGFIYMILTRKQPQRLTKIICLIYISAVIFSVGAILFTQNIPLQQVIILQTGRIWLFPVLISIISAPVLITRFVQNKHFLILFVSTLILTGLIFNSRNKLKSAGQNLDQWLTLQSWVNKNTSKNCLFLVPFYSRGFRMVSERSIVGEEKDGGHSLYSFKMAKLWNERKQDLVNWDELDTKQFNILYEKYKFDYFLTINQKAYPYTLVYNNQSYSLYKVKSDPSCSD